MHHRRKTTKLGRSPEHRTAMLAALVCSLIEEKRITTTLAKAKLARSQAERLVTVARAGSLLARQRVLAALRHRKPMQTFFKDIVPKLSGRNGGYTRIVKLGRRCGDNAETALVEWVGIGAVAAAAEAPKADAEKKK
jgi:large subunit ribosomal protein L17